MNAKTVRETSEQPAASGYSGGALLAILVVGMLVAAALPAGAIPPGWSSNGPNGGWIRVIKFHPTTPAIVYVGTHYSGVFKSTDAGATWAPMSAGLPVTAGSQTLPINDIAFDPIDPAIMYAVASEGTTYTRAGNGLYKTTNGGRGWTRVGPELPLVAVAVSPTNPLLIYTGGTGLRKSTDGGGTWTNISLGSVSTVNRVLFHPTAPGTVFVGVQGSYEAQGVWKTTDGGTTWTRPLGLYGYATIVFHPTDPSMMYAVGGQFHRSTDGGDNWSPANAGLPGYSQALAIDPNTPTTLYVADTNGGIYKTINAGDNWALSLGPKWCQTVAVAPNSHVFAGTTLEGHFKSTDSGATWNSIGPGAGSVPALAADPRNPGTLYAAAGMSRMQKSTDGGLSWAAVHNGLPMVAYSSGAQAVAVARSGPAAVYAGLKEGFYKSTDGGSSWTNTGAGIPAPTSPPLLAIAVDPITPSTVFAGANARIYRSIDSGANFGQVFTYSGLWATNITIAPSDSQVLYAGSANSFLYKSANGGTNWSVLQTVTVSGVAIHPTDPKTVYAAAASCDSYGGLFKSTDGFTVKPNGEPNYSVLPVTSRPGFNCIVAVALEPTQPSTVYAGTNRGVFRSFDAGATWHPYGLDTQWITVLVVDPSTPGRLYAGTQYGGVFVRDWAAEGVPIAEGVKPTSGSSSGGQTVTIWGGYFVPSETTVTFGGVPATNVLVEPNGLSLTAVVPANAVGPAEIIVTTLRGSSVALTGFTYTAAVPTLSSVVPNAGTVAGGTALTITGTNFAAGQTSVTVGGSAATGVAVTGATSLTAVTPAHGAGAADVVVTTPGGSATLSNGYTYTGAPPPFTDDPLAAGSTVVKVSHLNELRQRIDELRARYGLAAASWSDTTLVAGVTPARAVHLSELRTALDAVYVAAGRTPPAYGTPVIVGGATVIAAAHITEVRAGIVAIW
jgi:photosystem II stability/assembly factor-like uncharacterized protein